MKIDPATIRAICERSSQRSKLADAAIAKALAGESPAKNLKRARQLHAANDRDLANLVKALQPLVALLAKLANQAQ